MFGIVDRNSKEASVFTVLNNRTKEELLPLIIKNVATNGDIINMSNRSKDYLHKYCLSTRIYSDCCQANNKQDFKNNGYYLHRVNHSIWWGKGLFNTNSIEGLWSTLKRITNYFSGIKFNIINNPNTDTEEKKNFLDGWICASLFFRNCELKKYSEVKQLLSLCYYLKI